MVRDFCGHGVGQLFHDAPNILHYGSASEGVEMREGMIFTVEPMINLGRPHVKVLSDGWTAVTRDRSLSAQYEHTVGVTATGCEIFTLSPKGLDRPGLALIVFHATAQVIQPSNTGRVGEWRIRTKTSEAFLPSERRCVWSRLRPRRKSRTISDTATGLRERFASSGAGDAFADYELLELLLFRSIPRADTKPVAKALLARFGSLAEVLGAPPARLQEVKGVGAAVALDLKVVAAAAKRMARGEIQGRRDPVVLGAGARLLPRGNGLRGARAVPHPLPRQEERADRRRGAADRHGRPHAGLSARGDPPRAGTVGDRDHPRAQPSVRRSDAVARRHRDDEDHRRDGKPLGIAVHDHIIIGKKGFASMKGLKLI